MNTIDYDKFWGEIADLVEHSSIDKLPHEKTIRELHKEWNVSRAKAERIIKSLIDAKKLTSREIISGNGKPAVVYSPVIEDR